MAQKKSIIVPRWLSYNEDVVGDYTVLDSTGKPIKVVDPVTGKTINQVIEGVSNRPIRDLWQNQYLMMETLMPFANIKSISSVDSEAQGTANLEVDTLYNATVDGPYTILLPSYKMVGGSSVALAAGDSVRIKMQEGSIDQFTIHGDVSSGGYKIGDQDSIIIPPTENYFDYTFKFNGTSWDKFSSSGQGGGASGLQTLPADGIIRNNGDYVFTEPATLTLSKGISKVSFTVSEAVDLNSGDCIIKAPVGERIETPYGSDSSARILIKSVRYVLMRVDNVWRLFA